MNSECHVKEKNVKVTNLYSMILYDYCVRILYFMALHQSINLRLVQLTCNAVWGSKPNGANELRT